MSAAGPGRHRAVLLFPAALCLQLGAAFAGGGADSGWEIARGPDAAGAAARMRVRRGGPPPPPPVAMIPNDGRTRSISWVPGARRARSPPGALEARVVRMLAGAEPRAACGPQPKP